MAWFDAGDHAGMKESAEVSGRDPKLARCLSDGDVFLIGQNASVRIDRQRRPDFSPFPVAHEMKPGSLLDGRYLKLHL